MQEKQAKQKQQIHVTQLAAGKRFGRYKKEDKKEVRKAEVKEDEILENLKQIWQLIVFSMIPDDENDDEIYAKCLDKLKGVNCSSKDFELFSLALIGLTEEDFFQRKAGLFLSALIAYGKNETYLLQTKNLNLEIECFGYENRKNIIVEGDVSECLGNLMSDGKIIVKGNAEKYAGQGLSGGSIIINGDTGEGTGSLMDGGFIEVHGDAGEKVGEEMRGGIILIKGDSGDDNGNGMTGGEIHIEGNVGQSLGRRMRGGLIEIKGNAGNYVGSGFDSDYNVLSFLSTAILGEEYDQTLRGMKGGKIIVRGSSGEKVGGNMTGGEIHVEGEIGSIGNVIHGKIYHKGELIVDK